MKALSVSMKVTIIFWLIVFIVFGTYIVIHHAEFLSGGDSCYYVGEFMGGREGAICPPPDWPPNTP